MTIGQLVSGLFYVSLVIFIAAFVRNWIRDQKLSQEIIVAIMTVLAGGIIAFELAGISVFRGWDDSNPSPTQPAKVGIADGSASSHTTQTVVASTASTVTQPPLDTDYRQETLTPTSIATEQPAPSPTLTSTGTEVPLGTQSTNSGSGTGVSIDAPLSVTVSLNKSAAVFGNDLFITATSYSSVLGASGAVGSPGHPDQPFEGLQVGSSVSYQARATYQVRLTAVDSLANTATFLVWRMTT